MLDLLKPDAGPVEAGFKFITNQNTIHLPISINLTQHDFKTLQIQECKQAFVGRDATIPEKYEKFCLYFSGSCIPSTNESLFI
jgi:hypothetical protein